MRIPQKKKERHDGGNNARIYGAEYWRLEDGIHKIFGTGRF